MKRFLIATVPFVVGAVAENSTNLLPKDIITERQSTRYFDQIAAITESNKGKKKKKKRFQLRFQDQNREY
jgi:hypothetical protein